MNFDNFFIRPINEGDALKFYNLVARNSERLQYFPNILKANKDIESAKSLINERINLSKKKEFFTFIVNDRLTDEAIGAVFIYNFDWIINKAEIGFFLDRNFESRGIITKSVLCIANHCFTTLGLNKIFMRISNDNISSKRVAEKSGFEIEGVLKKEFKMINGELVDMNYYGLLKS